MIRISIINGLILTTLLFLSFFIGNATMNNFYLFYLLVILFVSVMHFHIRKKVFIFLDLYSIAIFVLFFLYNLYSSEFLTYANYEYYFWPLNAIILYVVLIYYISALNNKVFVKTSLFLFIIFMYILMFPSFIDLITAETKRFSFVFGPNMYYRVLSILFIVILYLFNKIEYKRKFNLVLFFLLPYTVAILHTGSRGAVVMLIFAYFYFMKSFMHIRKKVLFISLLVVVLSIGIMALLIDYEFNSRLFLLDYSEGSSIGIRLSAYFYLFENFFNLIFSAGISHYEFQNILGGEEFRYPHNIFLELVFYYGFFGAIVTVGIHFILFKIVREFILLEKYHHDFLIYITFILLLSSSFSGDFSDNFSSISLILFLFRMHFLNKISHS